MPLMRLAALLFGRRLSAPWQIIQRIREGLGKVEFTAYAFNFDRMKSLTTPPYLYQLLPPTAAN